MNLSKVIAEFNTFLLENINKPNKLHQGTLEIPQNRNVLALIHDCKTRDFNEFITSQTKKYVDLWSIQTLLAQFLAEKWPNINFYVNKKGRSLFEISAYELKTSDVGLDEKYAEGLETFIPIANITIKQKNTNFGKFSSYDHDFGKPKPFLTVSSIVFDENQEIGDVVEDLRNTLERRYQRKLKEAEKQKNDQQLFTDALNKYGITLEELEILKTLQENTKKKSKQATLLTTL